MNLNEYLKTVSGDHPTGNYEYLVKCTRSFKSDEEEEELNRSLSEWISAFMEEHPIISMIAIAQVDRGEK